MFANGYVDPDTGVWVENVNGVYDATNLPPPPIPPDPLSPLPRKVSLHTQLGNFSVDVDALRQKTGHLQALLRQLDPHGTVYNTVLRALQPKISAEFSDGTSRSMSPLGESNPPLLPAGSKGYGEILKLVVALFAVYGLISLFRQPK